MLKNFCTKSATARGCRVLRRRFLSSEVGLPVTRSPPVTGGSPELSARSDAVLRRTKACRRYGFLPRPTSGENNPNRNWCFPPVSAFLNGGAVPTICCPPASECWPELGADSQSVLRRTTAPRRYDVRPRTCSGEANPNRNWCLPPVSAFLDGGAVPTICCPPVTGT